MTSEKTPVSAEIAPNSSLTETSDALRAPLGRELPPAAQRALAEAEARRRLRSNGPAAAPEINGRGGLDPARDGDWEVKGIASDF